MASPGSTVHITAEAEAAHPLLLCCPTPWGATTQIGITNMQCNKTVGNEAKYQFATKQASGAAEPRGGSLQPLVTQASVLPAFHTVSFSWSGHVQSSSGRHLPSPVRCKFSNDDIPVWPPAWLRCLHGFGSLAFALACALGGLTRLSLATAPGAGPAQADSSAAGTTAMAGHHPPCSSPTSSSCCCWC